MTTINTVFPSRMWGIKAGEPRFFEHKELPFDDPTPAHEVCEFHDRHTGWYTHPDPSGDDLYVGYVFRVRVPRRMTPRNAPQDERRSGWLAGYQDGDGKHANGFLVDTSEVFLDKRDASRAADSFAERHAEKEREYQEAWQQGNDAAQLRDEANEIRDNLLHLMSVLQHARRALRQHVGRDAGDGITTIMCELVKERLGDINRLRRKRDRLLDVYAPLQDAVNEGYGR